MFTKVIPYEDFNGHERKEVFQFSLNEAEIWDLNLRTPGGLKGLYERIIQTEDGQQLADQFKLLIQMSYGVTSLDGRRFMKSEEIFKNFSETPAYPKLYMELATNSDSAAAFVNGIMPKDMVEKAISEGEAKPANPNVLQMPNFNAQPQTYPQPVQQAPVYTSAPAVDPTLPREVAPVNPQV